MGGQGLKGRGVRPLDAIWRNADTGGVVYVGNREAARNRDILREHNITNVVNCTSASAKCGGVPNFFEKDTAFRYFAFSVAKHHHIVTHSNDMAALELFSGVFAFIDAALARGESVLIHCLVGAHRAGTTGVAYLLHKTSLDVSSAITAAKQCRPVVDPIGSFPTLLLMLHRALTTSKFRTHTKIKDRTPVNDKGRITPQQLRLLTFASRALQRRRVSGKNTDTNSKLAITNHQAHNNQHQRENLTACGDANI